MTMPQVEYDYYTDTYKGGLSEADFGAALGHAVAAVKDLIAYNVPTGDAQVDAYRMAVCTACDVDAAYGFSGGVMEQVASAGIGSFSYSTPQGTAESVEVRTSSGSQRLDDAAQKTVRNWKFIPAKRGDTAVQSFVLVPIIFKLEQ